MDDNSYMFFVSGMIIVAIVAIIYFGVTGAKNNAISRQKHCQHIAVLVGSPSWYEKNGNCSIIKDNKIQTVQVTE